MATGTEARSATADALLTEHFRYTPLSLIDDVINTVNAILYRAVNAVESGLLNTPAAGLGFSGADAEEARRIEVEDGVHRLETLLSAAADRNFDKLEIYALRNILTVPEELEKWIRLAHYKEVQSPLPPSAATPESTAALRTQLHEERAKGLRLEAEHIAARKLLGQLRGLTGSAGPGPQGPQGTQGPQATTTPQHTTDMPHPPPGVDSLSFLSRPSSNRSGDLSTSARFAASQLPALRTLLAALRPQLPGLREDVVRETVRRAVDPDSERERRRAYLDGQAERAVRGAVGVVEKGADGAGLGNKVGEGEVRALEGVAGEGARRRGGVDGEMMEGGMEERMEE